MQGRWWWWTRITIGTYMYICLCDGVYQYLKWTAILILNNTYTRKQLYGEQHTHSHIFRI